GAAPDDGVTLKGTAAPNDRAAPLDGVRLHVAAPDDGAAPNDGATPHNRAAPDDGVWSGRAPNDRVRLSPTAPNNRVSIRAVSTPPNNCLALGARTAPDDRASPNDRVCERDMSCVNRLAADDVPARCASQIACFGQL